MPKNAGSLATIEKNGIGRERVNGTWFDNGRGLIPKVLYQRFH